ncbi:uncharacterized protein ARMOST_15041 [Armillaria ostoyae]|uniref:Uncharacterized protein n=1 Tax=Armillaria ostoyae TaxID=47428 RepID=A0A284RSE9_ARMOS|nr:uncharacterized protein ARMOST_15041 [Armillaria ostoyae]
MSASQKDATAAVPPEILSRIVSLSLETESPAESLDVTKGAWPYGRVCRRWRDLVLSDPFLWDDLVMKVAHPVPPFITYGPDGIDIVNEAEIQSHKRSSHKFLKDKTILSSSSVSILTEYLKRSRGLPLHVSLMVTESAGCADSSIFHAFFTLLLSHVPRWKTLEYTIPDEGDCDLVCRALIRDGSSLIHLKGKPPSCSSETHILHICYCLFFPHFADRLVSLDITPLMYTPRHSNHATTTMSRLRILKVYSTNILDRLTAPALHELFVLGTHEIAAPLWSFIERSQIFHSLRSLSFDYIPTPASVYVIQGLTALATLIMKDIIMIDLPLLQWLSRACPKLETLKISELRRRRGPHVHVDKECLAFLVQFLSDRLENGTLEVVSIQLRKPLLLDTDETLREQVEELQAKEGVDITLMEFTLSDQSERW